MDENLVNILSYCDNSTLMGLLKRSSNFRNAIETCIRSLRINVNRHIEDKKEKCFDFLASFPNLQSIYFIGLNDNNCEIMVKKIKSYRCFEKIECLNFQHNFIGDKAMNNLVEILNPSIFPNLNKINLSYNSFTMIGFNTLINTTFHNYIFPDLTYIDLHNNEITEYGWYNFIPKHGCFENLAYLNISSTNLKDRGCECILHLLEENELPNLEELYVDYNNITDIGVEILCDGFSLGNSYSICVLSLVGNRICDPGVSILSDICIEGLLPNLRKLNLGENKISNEGAIKLCEYLESNNSNTLEELYLNDNSIGYAGGKIIKDCLMKGGGYYLNNIVLHRNLLTPTMLNRLKEAIMMRRRGFSVEETEL